MRNLIVYASLALLVAAYAGVAILIFLNRASEKVVAAGIPIGVAGIIGVVLSLLVFGALPRLHTKFSTAYVFRLKSNEPSLLPYRNDFVTTIQARQFYSSHAELIGPDPNGERVSTIFHQLLQKSIIEWISQKYPTSWRMEIQPISFGGTKGYAFAPLESPSNSTTYSAERLRSLLGNNMFSTMPTPFGLGLPPHTTLMIESPQTPPQGREMGRIRIQNRFVTVLIETQSMQWVRGIAGYGLLAGLNDAAANELGHVVYAVEVRTNFSRWLSGNPAMPKYREWATSISDGLRQQFDEELVWQRAQEHYLLVQHMPTGK